MCGQKAPLGAAVILTFGLFTGCEEPKTSQPAAEQTNASGYGFSQGYPTIDAATKAIGDTDLQRAVQAYRFWYPTVSNEGIFQGNRAEAAWT